MSTRSSQSQASLVSQVGPKLMQIQAVSSPSVVRNIESRSFHLTDPNLTCCIISNNATSFAANNQHVPLNRIQENSKASRPLIRVKAIQPQRAQFMFVRDQCKTQESNQYASFDIVSRVHDDKSTDFLRICAFYGHFPQTNLLNATNLEQINQISSTGTSKDLPCKSQQSHSRKQSLSGIKELDSASSSQKYQCLNSKERSSQQQQQQQPRTSPKESIQNRLESKIRQEKSRINKLSYQGIQNSGAFIESNQNSPVKTFLSLHQSAATSKHHLQQQEEIPSSLVLSQPYSKFEPTTTIFTQAIHSLQEILDDSQKTPFKVNQDTKQQQNNQQMTQQQQPLQNECNILAQGTLINETVNHLKSNISTLSERLISAGGKRDEEDSANPTESSISHIQRSFTCLGSILASPQCSAPYSFSNFPAGGEHQLSQAILSTNNHHNHNSITTDSTLSARPTIALRARQPSSISTNIDTERMKDSEYQSQIPISEKECLDRLRMIFQLKPLNENELMQFRFSHYKRKHTAKQDATSQSISASRFGKYHNYNKLFMYTILNMFQQQNLSNLQVPHFIANELQNLIASVKSSAKNNYKVEGKYAFDYFSHAHYSILFLKLTEENIPKLAASPENVQLYSACFSVDIRQKLSPITISYINIIKLYTYLIFMECIAEDELLKLETTAQTEENLKIQYSLKVIKGVKKLAQGLAIKRF